ncbi:MAG: twin-arginine translocation signal domain-containing protein [Thermodesulfobacteriota bacterium]|nr:twin-arginine translocation signal domain-containing protein [Thermodesulfobacteriota bacterium]
MMNPKDHSPKKPDKPETSRRGFLKAGAAVAGAALLGDALKATAALAADQDQPNLDEVQLLFVQNARDVVMGKGRLTLIGVNPTTIFFADRPKRIAGHMHTEDFVLDWQEGTGKESFHADPPNATLSVFGQDEIVDVVVELKNPRLAGSALVYDIDVLEDEEQIPSGPVSLFIDPIGRPLSPTSAAGVHRRHRRRRRRRVRHVVR